MATGTTLTTDVQQMIDDSSYSSTVILRYLNEAMNQVAGQVKLPLLASSWTLYTNTTTVTQSGSGLDDLSITIPPTAGYTATSYVVTIDTAAATDKFKWSNDGGSTWEATGVSITGAAQHLENDIYVTFAATTGHTLTDSWSFTQYIGLPTDYDWGLHRVTSADVDGNVELYDSWDLFKSKHPMLDDVGIIDKVCLGKKNWLYCQPYPSSQDTIVIHGQRIPTEFAAGTSPDGLPDKYHRNLLTNYAAGEILEDEGDTELSRRRSAKYEYWLNELKKYIGPTDGAYATTTDSGLYADS